MAAIKLKSEKRIKQVVTSGGGAENANTYESDDIVYSQSDDSLKKSDGTNWKDLPVVPITKYYITANASSHYVFNGPGFDASANGGTGDRNPTIYLVRGQKYQFENLMGAHAFVITDQSNQTGTYSDGITNNTVSNGVLEFNVQHDAPKDLYYYCTDHAGAMKGDIKIVDASGGGGGASDFLGLSDTPGAFAAGDANKFVRVNGSNNGLEFSSVSVPGAIGDLSDVPAPAAVDANKFVKVNGTGNALIYADGESFNPMLHNQALGASNLVWNAGSGHGQQMNSGTGGLVIVTQAASTDQTNAAAQYLELDTRTSELNRTEGKWKYEFISGDQGKAFRLKIINGDSSNGLAALVTSSDFADIAQNDEKEIAGNQVFVLQYDGSQWKYYVRAW